MIRSDNHVHTYFSSDSDEPMENQVLQAIAGGLSNICFTDHMDYDYPDNEDHFDFLFDPESYSEEIEQLKKKYAGQIEIRKGIELGVKPGIEDKCRMLFSENSFDFVINSTHLVKNYDPFYPDFWENRSVKEGLDLYYKAVYSAIDIWTDFDVLGHIDYMTRYTPELKTAHSSMTEAMAELGRSASAAAGGADCIPSGLKGSASFTAENISSSQNEMINPLNQNRTSNGVRHTGPITTEQHNKSVRAKYLNKVIEENRIRISVLTEKYMNDYFEIMEDILKKIIYMGKGIEINTSGIKYGLGHTHPHEKIVKLYHDLGGEIITVGSDAHDKSRISADFDIAEQVLRYAGFRYYTEFRKRKPEFVPL